VPAGQAPHKEIKPDPGRDVRLEMSRLAAATDPLLAASDIETARDGPSYTFRTLELLREARPDAHLVFLMGADAAAGLEAWRAPERVLQLARLGIAARPGTGLDEAEAALERLGGRERAEVVRMPEIGVSSREIRRRVASGGPVRHLVPDAVAKLIDEQDLYRA
jgi:nicotinate-nucleotide adenylyltransferase